MTQLYVLCGELGLGVRLGLGLLLFGGYLYKRDPLLRGVLFRNVADPDPILSRP